ncbi:hypothetical protein MKX01_011924 [Papaver californicum]|nr:hypothetical protein MKX01_011924 [Papaver californicum]
MNYDFASPCSSPSTPSSPLPVSVDVGQERYYLSPSSSDSALPSPPFTPLSDKHYSSPEVSPSFQRSRQFNGYRHSTMILGWDNLRQPSAFSLDQEPHEEDVLYKENSCLKNLNAGYCGSSSSVATAALGLPLSHQNQKNQMIQIYS